MPQSFHLVTAHIIFSTKQRRPLLGDTIRPKMWAYLSGILQNLGCNAITIGGVADHVHILCNLSKEKPTTVMMEELKRDSSKWVKREFAGNSDFYWQSGYGIFSVSPSHREAVRRYILNQEEHHRKEDFKTELVRVLRKYQAQFDERYFWD